MLRIGRAVVRRVTNGTRQLRALFSGRYRFQQIMRDCGLALDFETNRDALPILNEIFVNRVYSDRFPFYEDATVVDIGAHKGMFSIFAALNTGDLARIIALEPSLSNFGALQRNIETLRTTKITAVRAGIFSERGAQTLHLNAANVNYSIYGKGSASPGKAIDGGGAETIDVVAIADLFESFRLQKIDFLKMDCEGAEYPAVFATPPRVFERIRVISMEFHDLKSKEQNGNTMAEFLRGVGYDIARFTYSPTRMNLNYGMLVALRSAPVR
jgi:FkbM family methyltransferase